MQTRAARTRARSPPAIARIAASVTEAPTDGSNHFSSLGAFVSPRTDVTSRLHTARAYKYDTGGQQRAADQPQRRRAPAHQPYPPQAPALLPRAGWMRRGVLPPVAGPPPPARRRGPAHRAPGPGPEIQGRRRRPQLHPRPRAARDPPEDIKAPPA